MKLFNSVVPKFANTIFNLKGENIDEVDNRVNPIIDVMPPITDFVNISGGTTVVLPEKFLLWGIYIGAKNSDIAGVCTSMNVLFTPENNTEVNMAFYIPVGTATVPQYFNENFTFPRPIVLVKGSQVRSAINGNLSEGQIFLYGAYLR